MFAKRIGARDTVPAMLEPGEAVLNVGAKKMVGKSAINKLNARGRKVMGYSGGTSGVEGYSGQVKSDDDPRYITSRDKEGNIVLPPYAHSIVDQAVANLMDDQEGDTRQPYGGEGEIRMHAKESVLDAYNDGEPITLDTIEGRVMKRLAGGRGYQSGGIVPGPGNIGYVGTEEQDPRWADISLRAPGINIGQLKQKAAASGISPEAIKGIMSLFQKGAGNAYTGGGRGGSSITDTGVPEAWFDNAQGYQGGTSDVEFGGATGFHPMSTWYDYRYGGGGNPQLYGGPGAGKPVDIGTSAPGTKGAPSGYTYVPTFGNVPTEDLPFYTGGNSQPGQPAQPLTLANQTPIDVATGQPIAVNPGQPLEIGNTVSGDEDYPSGRGLSPTAQYSGGRGLISSTAPQNSGNVLTRLAGNLRGQFPSDLGGMTDPAQAAQNARYWSAINGPGLSNPSFYPGGGSSPGTSGLNTPGGVPFDPSGVDLSMLSSGFSHGAGPLSPVNYGAFLYPAGMTKPNYANYLAQYPQAIQSGPLLGGSAGRVPVSAR